MGARHVVIPVSPVPGIPLVGNHRLAPIDDGWVDCLHVDTAEHARCRFRDDSGGWVERGKERFALVGQANSKDGRQGGEFVVAAPVESGGAVRCMDPSLLMGDAPGVPFGTELDLRTIREQLRSPHNALGVPLVNFCTLPVWTSSNPHPDGATPIPGTAGPPYCYTGIGAALNDRDGLEKDEFGRYITPEVSHEVFSSGFIVPAAKRPATRSHPKPDVFPNTPIVWRAFDPNVRIGN